MIGPPHRPTIYYRVGLITFGHGHTLVSLPPPSPPASRSFCGHITFGEVTCFLEPFEVRAPTTIAETLRRDGEPIHILINTNSGAIKWDDINWERSYNGMGANITYPAD